MDCTLCTLHINASEAIFETPCCMKNYHTKCAVTRICILTKHLPIVPCPNCGKSLYEDPETPLDDIPEELLIVVKPIQQLYNNTVKAYKYAIHYYEHELRHLRANVQTQNKLLKAKYACLNNCYKATLEYKRLEELLTQLEASKLEFKETYKVDDAFWNRVGISRIALDLPPGVGILPPL